MPCCSHLPTFFFVVKEITRPPYTNNLFSSQSQRLSTRPPASTACFQTITSQQLHHNKLSAHCLSLGSSSSRLYNIAAATLPIDPPTMVASPPSLEPMHLSINRFIRSIHTLSMSSLYIINTPIIALIGNNDSSQHTRLIFINTITLIPFKLSNDSNYISSCAQFFNILFEYYLLD